MENKKEEKQTKLSDFTTIAIKKDDDISKIILKLKNKISKETSLPITNAILLNIIFDCIDENKLQEKIKLLKEGMGK